ncbi:MAG: F0F1 ATP synthase subunit epsilon [Candidatus Abyssobacteria bacterium SURF_17]|uniref:ATP synthase epsilon chain n=1 Tax=Candidatus Abyssobacteria bacterium SURF_17 TaxID=2093361 RepID=A0A419EPT8_9BACT|nr:MAG: F0F1 ATP synthase subunit epsilon [Candidatus Abyssubacteria bacterium SURF_17]
MARPYPLEIVTLKRTVFKDDVECVTVPGGLGYLGILAGHAPLLTNVEVGLISIKLTGSDVKMAVGEGFLVVTQKGTTLLVDTAEKKEEIDVERARAAMARARERLGSRTPDIDIDRAEAALKRAVARLKVAGAL